MGVVRKKIYFCTVQSKKKPFKVILYVNIKISSPKGNI